MEYANRDANRYDALLNELRIAFYATELGVRKMPVGKVEVVLSTEKLILYSELWLQASLAYREEKDKNGATHTTFTYRGIDLREDNTMKDQITFQPKAKPQHPR